MQRLVINTVLARGTSTVLNFLIALLIARHSGPAIKGEVTLLITTVWFFIFLSNILGGQALVYLIPRNKIELLVLPAYAWSVVVAGAGFIVLHYTHLVHEKHIPSVAALSLLSAVISIHQSILFARKYVTNANIVQLLPLLFQLAGVLLCFYFLRINDAYAYIYASLAGYFFTAVVSFFMVRKAIHFSGFISDFSWKELAIPVRFGLLYQLVEILQLINLRYYFYPLGLQQGNRYLGIYSIGISILEAVWVIPRGIATIHYISTSNSTEVKQEADRTIQLVKISFALCLITLLMIWLVPSQLYVMVFGPGFSDVRHSMRYLFPGILVYSVPIVISSFYLGIGRYRQLIVSNLIGSVALIILASILIPKYVMSGAGLAASASFGLTSLVLFIWFIIDNKAAISQFVITGTDITGLKELIRRRTG